MIFKREHEWQINYWWQWMRDRKAKFEFQPCLLFTYAQIPPAMGWIADWATRPPQKVIATYFGKRKFSSVCKDAWSPRTCITGATWADWMWKEIRRKSLSITEPKWTFFWYWPRNKRSVGLILTHRFSYENYRHISYNYQCELNLSISPLLTAAMFLVELNV